MAIVSPTRHLLFANPAMRALLPGAVAGVRAEAISWRAITRWRRLAEQTLASRQSRGPVSAIFAASGGDHGERLIQTHPVSDARRRAGRHHADPAESRVPEPGAVDVRYSRKLVALGRLSAGVAHEVKNPLNAMMIHLELLRQRVSARAPSVDAPCGARRGRRGAPTSRLP